MAKIGNFEIKGFFYDDARFPRGFRKSGEFTVAESDILESYGHTLKALSEGRQQPNSSQESRFVKVCQSKAKPVSFIEKTWMKYLEKKNRHTVATSFSISSSHRYRESDISYDDQSIPHNI